MEGGEERERERERGSKVGQSKVGVVSCLIFEFLRVRLLNKLIRCVVRVVVVVGE